MTPAEPEPPPRIHVPALLTPDDAQRAFWWRVLALLVDVLVLSLVDILVNSVFGVVYVTSGSPVPALGSGFTQFTTSTDVGWVWLAILSLIYYFGFEALFGATVGKWLVGLRVTDREGRLPAPRQIALRTVMRVVDGLPVGYLIGGGVALSSPMRLRLGDHLARTYVVRRAALTAPALTAVQLRRRAAFLGGVLLICSLFSAAFFYYGRPPLVVQSMANTRQMMFSDGVSAYTLSSPAWGTGTVTYQVMYRTEHPIDTCHSRLTLDWTFPSGWQPGFAESFCDTHTP